MLNRATVQEAVNAGTGVLRLEPSWVPRSFMMPGRRLKLHPDDLYAFGGHRGGINERWFSSTTNADNGPGTPPDEGLSYVHPADGKQFLLKDAVESRRRSAARRRRHGAREAAGTCSASSSTTWGRFRTTCTRATSTPSSSATRASPRPTTSRRNTTRSSNNFPYTFMGLEPGTTKDDVRRCLENWNEGDNGIIFHCPAPIGSSRAPAGRSIPGILHAPGSLVTYEPQVNSDVFAMFQSEVEGRIVAWSLLIKDVLPEYHHDLDYIIGMLDWDANVNPEFGKSNKRHSRCRCVRSRKPKPRAIANSGSPTARGYYSAKELTVLPGAA